MEEVQGWSDVTGQVDRKWHREWLDREEQEQSHIREKLKTFFLSGTKFYPAQRERFSVMLRRRKEKKMETKREKDREEEREREREVLGSR